MTNAPTPPAPSSQPTTDDAADLLPPGITLARATLADAGTFVEIHEEAARWLWEQGIRQWKPGVFKLEWLTAPIERGELYLAWSDGQPIATILLEWSDVATWGPRPDDAGYVHGLRVRRATAGQGVGRALLAWAERAVARAGRPYVRLDCIADNPRLCRYYEEAGFTRVEGAAYDGYNVTRFEKRVDFSAPRRERALETPSPSFSPTRGEEPASAQADFMASSPLGAVSTAGQEPLSTAVGRGRGEVTLLTTGAGVLALRRATLDDIPAIVAIHEDTMTWAYERGFRAQGPYPTLAADTRERVTRHAVYLATRDTRPAASVTLAEDAAPAWGDIPGEALSLYALAVKRDFAGGRVGLALLNWAAGMAHVSGYPALRLECLASNPALRTYYERAGFTFRGEAATPGRTLARYERAVSLRDRLWSEKATARAASWSWYPPETQVFEEPDYLLTYWPEAPHRNIVHWSWAENTAAAEAQVDAVLARVRATGRTGLRWWVAPATTPAELPERLAARGFTVAERLDVLTFDLGTAPLPILPRLDVPPDAQVELARDGAALRQMYALDAEIFGDPPAIEERMDRQVRELEEAERAGTRTEFQFLARVDGQPAGSAGMTIAGEVARLWGGGVAPWARGRGLYRALVADRLRLAHARGVRIALTKARVGTSGPILRRAGFRALGQEVAYELRWA
jgi:ribosomal protein S18 acetylase RimI-like enzyme